MLLLAFLMLIPGVETKETPVKCEYPDEKKVNECLQPMLDYATKLQAETGAMQFPLQGGHVFNQLCSIYTDFKTCVSSVRCDSLSIDAVHASYSYMCGSGQPLFQKHAGCFAEVEAQKEYISCKIAATQAISEAQGAKSSSTEAYLTEMCRAMDGYLRCSHPIILAKCGADAWTLVSTVTRDSLGVTMPNCDMHSALF
ncbi:hypothetical protein GCK72_009354 [Caenorhabditis remanei]|uniref:T20D4.11-like domain-containing protein n=1 Tax=Caenorhabditis remanei TaxID=31234 RepID=E3LSN2_CAERE|nr:hypothetical protein GCK72_009354 [Caenorhabditis remanei]EFP09293.1 hypothetical protein CRE_25345 [Caenorhabditis remanei]KAF1761100.1 hypothetical protein GCK72_009354 [Caenorhabditis remanei]